MSTIIQKYETTRIIFFFSTGYHLPLWLDGTSMFISRHHHRSLYFLIRDI